jgi:hypothetical protein
MIQKIALLIGGLGAAAVLAFALGLGSFVFAHPAATPPTDTAVPLAVAKDTSATTRTSAAAGNESQGAQSQTRTKKVVDKVYIAAAPPPVVVHVAPAASNTRPAPTAPPAQPQAPRTTPTWHDDGGNRESHESGEHGQQRGDD